MKLRTNKDRDTKRGSVSDEGSEEGQTKSGWEGGGEEKGGGEIHPRPGTQTEPSWGSSLKNAHTPTHQNQGKPEKMKRLVCFSLGEVWIEVWLINIEYKELV